METNIYYQLAQTECALDRCKAKLFKKNLAIVGLLGLSFYSMKALWMECKKVCDIRKERDEAVEEKVKATEELRQMQQKEADKKCCCDGHVKMTDVYDKLKND